jgi:hypothetical protein
VAEQGRRALEQARVVGHQPLAERRTVDRQRQVIAPDPAKALWVGVGADPAERVAERGGHLAGERGGLRFVEQATHDHEAEGLEVGDLLLAEAEHDDLLGGRHGRAAWHRRTTGGDRARQRQV